MNSGQRQQVLVLWLTTPELATPVIAWSLWDGTGERNTMAGDEEQPPYATGLDALRDGWRLFNVSPALPHPPGTETDVSYLKYEYWFEKLTEPTR